MIGIYKITNKCNGMSYIGQSNDIKRRWREHCNKMNIKNTLLYQAMREYGKENFSFEVIEECALVELNDKEKYYINKYNTMSPKGYNMSTIENIQHKINQDIANEIIYDLKNTVLTGEEIAKKYNVSHCLISQINNGKMWKQKNHSYPIRKKEEKKKEERKWKCPFTREELKQKIRQFSFSEIGRNCNVSDNAVRKWCDKYGLPRRKKDINSYSNEEWDKI